VPRIVVLGSLNMDLVVRATRFAQPGETIMGSDFLTAPGGKGANQAVAARRLGADVAIIGRVGDDAFGQVLRTGLAAEGLDVRLVDVTPSASTGVALITVDDSGENTIVVVPGANGLVDSEDLERALPAIADADALLLQLEVPLPVVMRAASHAHAARVAVILNAAPAQPLPSTLLPLVDYLVVNETEVIDLARPAGDTPEAAARALQARGARAVVVTLGAAGARLVSPDGTTVSAGGFRVEAVDTTAAGDAFVGALAVALAEGATPVEALQFGNAAGAVTVTRPGAQPSLPTRAAVDALLASRR
jgi:ribokinase